MMTDEQIRQISTERLERWKELCLQYHTTPALVVTIGHDTHAGEIHVMAPENLSDPVIADFLKEALDQINGNGWKR